MLDRGLQGLHLSFDGNGFMDRGLRQAALPSPEETDYAVRPPSRVADPPALEEIFSRKAVTVYVPRRVDDLPDHAGRLRRDPFIGVQDEDPVLPALFDGKLLLRPEAAPRLAEDLTAEIGGNPERLVPASGIHDDDLSGEGDAPQTIGKVLCLIFYDHGHGKRRLLNHLSSPRARRTTSPPAVVG